MFGITSQWLRDVSHLCELLGTRILKILWWSICCKSFPSLLFVFPTSAFPQWSDRFTAMTAPFSQSGPIYIYTYMLPDLHQHHHISSLISTRGALETTYNCCTTYNNHPIQSIPSAHNVIKIFWSIELKRSVDLRWLLDPVLQSPLDDLVNLEISLSNIKTSWLNSLHSDG